MKSRFLELNVKMCQRRNVQIFLLMFLARNAENFPGQFVSKTQSMSRSRFQKRFVKLYPRRSVLRFPDRSIRMFQKLLTRKNVSALNQNLMVPILATVLQNQAIHHHQVILKQPPHIQLKHHLILRHPPPILHQHQVIPLQPPPILLQNQTITALVHMVSREASPLKLLLLIMNTKDGDTNIMLKAKDEIYLIFRCNSISRIGSVRHM